MVNHGDALQITYGRLRLVASRLGITPQEAAENILATMLGKINHKEPRGTDSFEVKMTRVEDKGHTEWVPPPSVDLPLRQPRDKNEEGPRSSRDPSLRPGRSS